MEHIIFLYTCDPSYANLKLHGIIMILFNNINNICNLYLNIVMDTKNIK